MNNLVKKQSCYIKLLLTTTNQQQKAMIQSITPSQMKAVVQIVYNVLHGNPYISEKDKKKLKKRKLVIRRFIAKRLSFKSRIKLFLKYFSYISLLLRVIETEL